jgi:hypothetical protein
MNLSPFFRSISRVLLLAALIGGAAFLSTTPAFAIEQPLYSVIEKVRFEGSSIEIRDYAPYLVAETTVETRDFDDASSEGFRRLADFIFGANNGNVEMDMTAPVETRRPEKIEMTAPVATEGQEGAWVVRFMMPSKYTLDTLPRPNDPRISIVQVPSRTLAVISFSGLWTLSNFAENTTRLERFLEQEGFESFGSPSVARYNMPLTPWFLRTNEIQIEVRY